MYFWKIRFWTNTEVHFRINPQLIKTLMTKMHGNKTCSKYISHLNCPSNTLLTYTAYILMYFSQPNTQFIQMHILRNQMWLNWIKKLYQMRVDVKHSRLIVCWEKKIRSESTDFESLKEYAENKKRQTLRVWKSRLKIRNRECLTLF